MKSWEDISLFKYQKIEEYNTNENLDDLAKVLFSVCVVYDKTEYELDQAGLKVAGKLSNRVQKIFEQKFDPVPEKRIGRYFLNYNPASMTFGQYVELMFFMQDPPRNAHFIMASISNKWLRKNRSKDHRRKAEYFLHQPVTKIIGSLKLFIERFAAFNAEYKSLFGLNDEAGGKEAQGNFFNKRYGWIYSATQVAKHEGIKLDEVFGLPVRQALNDLAFLKAKSEYEAEQIKRA